MVWQQRPPEGAVHFPLQSIAAGATATFQPGNGVCPRLGWIIAIQSNISEKVNEADDLTGKLEVTFSGAGTTFKTIAGAFSLQDVNAFLSPFENCRLTLKAGAVNATKAAVSFYPVNDPELGASYQSVLYHYDLVKLNAGSTSNIDISTGATDWGVITPREDWQVQLSTVGGASTVSGFQYNGTQDVTPGSPAGIKYFPAIPAGVVSITNGSGAPSAALYCERYDLRAVGGA
jgi:hypothetical protein